MSTATEQINKLISWAGSAENLAFYLTVEGQFFLSNWEVNQARAGLIKAGRLDLLEAAEKQADYIEAIHTNRYDIVRKFKTKPKSKIKIYR